MANFTHRLGRTLLVESNDVMRRMAAEQLLQSGADEVVAVSHVRYALEKLEAQDFDLVLYSRDFAGREEHGQRCPGFLEELQRENLLAPHTLYLMMGEPSRLLQGAHAFDIMKAPSRQ